MAFRRHTTVKSISSRALIGRGGRVFLILFGAVFALVGLGVMAGLTVLPILQWWGAQGWVETPCIILGSEVQSHSSSDGTTYSIDISYDYEYSGEEYASDRYNFMGGSSSGYGRKEAVVKRYPAGSAAQCYVDPANPGQAVLDKSFSTAYLIGLFGLPFFLIGAFVILTGFRQRKSGRSLSEGGRPQTSHPANAAGDPITLKPKQSPLAKLITVTFIALFWNGIVSVFLGMLIFGEFSWFLAILLTPFVLIGLALIAGVGHCFLALFNPRPELELCPGAIPLGAVADLEWAILGSASRIARLRIWIEGQEAATYRRGTDTCTDHNTFERIPILQAENASDIRVGKVQFALPEFSMHSFDAPNNKITWKLKVHGDIHRWPDIDEEYDVTVLPVPPQGG